MLGADEHGALGDTQQEEQDGGSTSAVAAQQEGEDQPRWRSAVEGVAARVYPWAHLALEGASFGYMLGYLLGATEHFSPAMAMAGVVPRRVTAAEAASAEAVQKRRRNAAVQRAAGRAGGAARAATVRTAHAVSDSARVLLVGAVLGYKVLEWWYNVRTMCAVRGSFFPSDVALTKRAFSTAAVRRGEAERGQDNRAAAAAARAPTSQGGGRRCGPTKGCQKGAHTLPYLLEEACQPGARVRQRLRVLLPVRLQICHGPQEMPCIAGAVRS